MKIIRVLLTLLKQNKMRQVIIGILFTLCFISVKAQGIVQGYIINIEDNKAYLDVTSPKVKVGDVLSVYSDAGYMIHPVTKKKIKKEGSIIADLEVVEVNNEYSVATIYPEEAVKKLKAGMIAQMPELTPEMKDMIEKEQKAIANEIEAASNNPENFTTAEQVIQWHLKSTGLDKMAANPPRSYLLETRETITNKKGKNVSVTHLTRIVDIPTQRVYTKVDIVILKNMVIASSSVISNGVGWVKIGKKKPKQLENENVRGVVESIDIIKNYTCKGVTFTLGGDFVIDGKSCFELESSRSGKSAKSYIDKKTGLLVAKHMVDAYNNTGEHLVGVDTQVKRDLLEEKIIEYRQFGDYLLPSTTQAELDKGKHRKIELLQFIPNYPIDDFQFTKEALTVK